MRVSVRDACLEDGNDARALVELIDSYAVGAGGQGAPLAETTRERMVSGLRAQPSALVLLAMLDEQAVGVAVCFWGFSTFAAAPLLNVHDFAVLPQFRGQGIGAALLAEVERRARDRGACKLTLEVRSENHAAQRLYHRAGFGPQHDPPLFLSKPLDSGLHRDHS